MGAVGKALGITINPPPKSENSHTLEAIARASGFRTRQVTLTANWWQKDCGVLLGFTKAENQPIAILPIKPTKYEILNPVDLTRAPINRKTASQIASFAYTFYRPLPDKEITFFDTFKFAFRGSISDLIKIAWVGIIATLFGMVTPQITGMIIDYAIPDAQRHLLIQMGLGLLAASFGVMVFQLAQTFAILRVQTQVSYDTQSAVWDRLLKLKPSFFRQYSTGDLHNRVSAVTQIRNRLSGTLLRTIFISLFSLLNFGLLLIYSIPLAFVALTVALVVVLFTTITSLIIRKKIAPLEQLSGEIFGLTVQLIGGVSKLRVAAAESEAFAYWAKKYTQQVKLMLSTQLVEDILTTFNVILPAFSSILLFSFAVYFTTQQSSTNELSTGTFLAFNTAFTTFISGVTRLSNSLISILEVSVLWERSQPILTTPTEVDNQKYHPGKLSGNDASLVCSRRRPTSTPTSATPRPSPRRAAPCACASTWPPSSPVRSPRWCWRSPTSSGTPRSHIS